MREKRRIVGLESQGGGRGTLTGARNPRRGNRKESSGKRGPLSYFNGKLGDFNVMGRGTSLLICGCADLFQTKRREGSMIRSISRGLFFSPKRREESTGTCG